MKNQLGFNNQKSLRENIYKDIQVKINSELQNQNELKCADENFRKK